MSVNIDPDIVLPIRPFFRVRPFLSISRNPSDVTFRLFFSFGRLMSSRYNPKIHHSKNTLMPD